LDWHRFDADPHPDLNFHIDVDPDRIPNFTHVGKSEFFLYSDSFANLQCFIFLICVKDVIILNILDSILKWKICDLVEETY
jgi:hypothetical protein